VVWLPLVLLAIPSAIIGFFTIEPILFGEFFKGVIFVDDAHRAMEELRHEFHGPVAMALHSLTTPVFWLALAGVVTAYIFYIVKPEIPVAIKKYSGAIYTLFDNKYYLDKFNEVVVAGGAIALGRGLWNVGDKGLIDGLLVNGSAKVVAWTSSVIRRFQTGYLYHYAFVMILGVLGFLTYKMFPFMFPFAK
jgi:NADH-quinone oxidoreductase subunit L